MGSISVLLIGAFAGHKADQHFLEPKRYSTAAIYEIVNYCANPQSYFITTEQQQLLAHTCICALNKTMAQVAETELKVRAAEFRKLFQQHTKNCQ